jgi:DNA-binding transcriptional MocR family regulator
MMASLATSGLAVNIHLWKSGLMVATIGPDRLARLVGQFDRDPAYRGLCAALQELIGDGRIALGSKLPSERALAPALGVSRTTVTRAYSDLVAAGYAAARHGSGTYTTAPIERRRAHDRSLRPARGALAGEPTIDLNIAAGAATPGVVAAYQRAVTRLPPYLASDGYLPSGLPELQAAIADTFERRGLPTTPEQIVITTGALSAIAIVASALSRPGDRVLVESPVYANAIDALRSGGARLVTAPLADPLADVGWDLDGIDATVRQTSPHLAYLIPDFHNPTGFLMSAADRERYGAVLRASRTIPVVDETLQALNLSHEPMPPPFAAHHAEAITIGSASKMFWGGLRVGWIRAPRAQVDRIVAARIRVDLGTSLIDQLTVAELVAGADDILETRRNLVRRQRDALIAAIREHLPTWRFRAPTGGLCLWVQIPSGSATRLAADVERDGIAFAPGPVFMVEGGSDSWVRLPYARPERELVDAVQRIARHYANHDPVATAAQRARVLVA